MESFYINGRIVRVGLDGLFVDEDDSMWVNPRYRDTKDTHPYSFSEYFIYGNREKIKDCSGDYSDRMIQWKRGVYFSAWEEHVNTRNWRPDQIQNFLRAYHENPNLELTGVAEGCNVSTGYPYYIFWYKAHNETDTKD